MIKAKRPSLSYVKLKITDRGFQYLHSGFVRANTGKDDEDAESRPVICWCQFNKQHGIGCTKGDLYKNYTDRLS